MSNQLPDGATAADATVQDAAAIVPCHCGAKHNRNAHEQVLAQLIKIILANDKG